MLPNSSTTMARPTWRARNSGSSSLGGLGLRHDQHFAQHAPQIESRRRQIFCDAAFAIEQHPQHVFDMHEAEDVIFRSAIYRNARALRGGEGAHHFIEGRFHRQGVHVRPWHHDFAHLHLGQFDGADDKFFFAGGQQASLTRLLNLNLQFLGGVRHAVALRLR